MASQYPDDMIREHKAGSCCPGAPPCSSLPPAGWENSLSTSSPRPAALLLTLFTTLTITILTLINVLSSLLSGCQRCTNKTYINLFFLHFPQYLMFNCISDIMSILLHHRDYVALLVDITLPVASVSSHLTWNKQIIGSSFSEVRPAPQADWLYNL